MVRLERGPQGLAVHAGGYRLSFPADRPFAMLEDGSGNRWAELFLACSVHTRGELDETGRLEPAVAVESGGAVTVTVAAVSSVWGAKRIVFVCREEYAEAYIEVEGQGRLTDCHFFGGYYSGHLRWGSGFFQSGARFASLFNPEPTGAERRAVPSGQSAIIDVMGTSLPGKGHWFYTPAPFYYAVSQSPVSGTAVTTGSSSFGADQGGSPLGEDSPAARVAPAVGPMPAGPWLGMGLAVAPGQHHFTGFHYDALEGAWSLRLAYEGQTTVDGLWRSPSVRLFMNAQDPYQGMERYVSTLVETGLVKMPDAADRPDWWSEPIQCGWGAQCHLGNVTGVRAPDLCRQEHYDSWLGELASHGLKPGILVLDDKWSAEYGTCVADAGKWPDLKGWIARRHADGQKVLLWWKAWDPEGLSTDLCVRNAAGMPVAADPSNPGYEAALRAAVRLMLSAEGYDADGFKVDFSARTPSGPALTRHGREWGVELLHKLLWILHDEAKQVKADALVMTHTPNPYFASVTDMIRLNDIVTEAPVVAQMTHRAKVARIGCPTLLIDTDNWPMPSREAWREYLKVQLDLGIPSLYFATHIDCRGGEPLEEQDYAALRSLWAEARRRKEG